MREIIREQRSGGFLSLLATGQSFNRIMIVETLAAVGAKIMRLSRQYLRVAIIQHDFHASVTLLDSFLVTERTSIVLSHRALRSHLLAETKM